MARLVPMLLVAFLLAGTAAAFAVTQRLKLERSPVFGTRFDEVAGPARPAELSFRLRQADTVTATVVDGDGNSVHTLLEGKRRPAGRLAPRWDGSTDSGETAAEGIYHLRVRLAEQRRTIELPNDIRFDTTAPELTVVSVTPRVFSPDGDGRADRVIVRYDVGETARPLLFVDGRQAGKGRFRVRRSAAIDWYGKVDGVRARPGTYRLTLRAEDQAGNVSPPSDAVVVRLRYVQIGRGPLRARAGQQFRVPLDTDVRSVRWRLAGRTGVGPASSLRVRAPQRPGRFRLYVSANRRADSATVVVRAAPAP